MKFSLPLRLLSASEMLALASSASISLFEFNESSISPLGGDLIQRDPLDWCDVANAALDMVEHVPQEYRAYVYATGSASAIWGATAWAVCRSFRGNDEGERCKFIGVAVGGLIAGVGSSVAIWHNWPTHGVQSTDASGLPSKRHEFMQASVENYLLRRGLVYDAVNILSLASRDEENASTSIEILGVLENNGMVSDHMIHIQGNGTGSAKLTFPSPLAQRGLERRHQGPGFKISYDFPRFFSGPVPQDNSIEVIADTIGQDWETRMNKVGDKANLYFGQADFTNSMTMAFRISQYTDTFSDTYDDVYQCGKINL